MTSVDEDVGTGRQRLGDEKDVEKGTMVGGRKFILLTLSMVALLEALIQLISRGELI